MIHFVYIYLPINQFNQHYHQQFMNKVFHSRQRIMLKQSALYHLQGQGTKAKLLLTHSIYFVQYQQLQIECLYSTKTIRIIIDSQQMAQNGNFENPIDLNDDESQQKKTIIDKLEEVRNRAILDEAKISGSKTEICLAVVKTMIPGSSLTKQRIVRKEIINYFYKTINIKIHSEHFNSRREPDYSDSQTQTNPCELILYGVDFLTTLMILNRFKIADAALKQIKWIDDSSCKLIYGCEQETEKAIKSQLIDADSWKTKQEEDNNSKPRGWFSLRPYWIHSFERVLYVRYATNQEKDLQRHILGKYEQYQKAEEELYLNLLVTFHAVQKYIRIMEQIQMQNKRIRRNHRQSGCRIKRKNNQLEHQGIEAGSVKNYKSKIIRKHQHQANGLNHIHLKQITTIRYEHLPIYMLSSDQLLREKLTQNFDDPQYDSQELNFQRKPEDFKDTHGIEHNLSFELKKTNNVSNQEDNEDINCNLSSNSILWSPHHHEKVDLSCDLSFVSKLQLNTNQDNKENDELSLNFKQLRQKDTKAINVQQQDEFCFPYKKSHKQQQIHEDYSFHRTASSQPQIKQKRQVNIFDSYKKKEMSKYSIPLDISSDESDGY